jgi:hypothetical protein
MADPSFQNSIVSRFPATPRFAGGLGKCLALSAAAFVSDAGSNDLISHNGFEPCWSRALSVDSFLQRLDGSTDAREVCLPPAEDGSSCATATCSDGSPGCSVTLRGGEHVPAIIAPGDPGSMRIDGSAGFEPFSMPVVIPTVGACTLNFVDTSDVLIQHQLVYQLRPDGNSGYYTFNADAMNVAASGLTDDDVSLSGNFGCLFASLGLPFYLGIIEGQVGSAIAQTISSETEGQSLCPLP